MHVTYKMRLATIVVTRSKSCHVKTLHTVLRLNLMCIQSKGIQNEVVYVNDDPYEKSNIIQKYMKTADRILYIDFGVSMDEGSIAQVFKPHEIKYRKRELAQLKTLLTIRLNQIEKNKSNFLLQVIKEK